MEEKTEEQQKQARLHSNPALAALKQTRETRQVLNGWMRTYLAGDVKGV